MEVQEFIDQEVAVVTNGKAFVRPSGTEDILRLYCEAQTVEEMDKLAANILGAFENKFKYWNKKKLRLRELNPGLPRDRRGY